MGIAYDNGINFFDNAEAYAAGESEKIMGRVLHNKKWDRTSFIVSSKVFFGSRSKETKPNQAGLSRKHIMEACNEALQRLQVDYLDLFFCHRPDKKTPIEETVWAMNTLIQQGKIFYWGTSEWSGVEITEAHRVAEHWRLIGPTMEQAQYNLFERNKIENEFLPLYDRVGLGTTVWSPLASGLLTGKYNEGIPPGSRFGLKGFEWLTDSWMEKEKINKVRQLRQVADALGTSTAALSIAWCIKNPHVTSAILGATKREQLLDNLKAVEVVSGLTPQVMDDIEKIMQTKPALPQF
jgi:voltage-dependent potassium channel beta subunit